MLLDIMQDHGPYGILDFKVEYEPTCLVKYFSLPPFVDPFRPLCSPGTRIPIVHSSSTPCLVVRMSLNVCPRSEKKVWTLEHDDGVIVDRLSLLPMDKLGSSILL